MRRAPGPLGWLIVLDPILGDYRWPFWRWWRRRVHPWTDTPDWRTAGGPEAQGSPIVPGVVFVSERESGPWIDCVPTSGTMVAGWARREPSPHLNDAHRIREGAGLPHSGGMTDAQLADGLADVYGTAGSTIAATKSAVLAALSDGRGLTWFHTYGRLPTDLRRWSPSFTGGHCAAIIGRKSATSELVGWFDPLATDGWTGEFVDIDVLLAADWGDPARSYVREQEVPELPGSTFTLTGSQDGTVTVVATGKEYVRVRDDGHFAIQPVPWVKRVYAQATYQGKAAYLIGEEAALVMAADGEFAADPAPEAPPADGAYSDGARDMWDAWSDGLGLPERPPE